MYEDLYVTLIIVLTYGLSIPITYEKEREATVYL